MQDNHELKQQLQSQLQNLTPELQEYVNRLQQDSEWLERLLHYDSGFNPEIPHVLGYTIMFFLDRSSAEGGLPKDGKGEALCLFYDEVMLAMKYVNQRFTN